MNQTEKYSIVINRLKGIVKEMVVNEEDMDSRSFDYEEGIVISGNDARLIIELFEIQALESYKDGWVKLPDGFKMYTCTDCRHQTILFDNNDVMVGICSKCQHPLWNEPLPTPPQNKTI